MRAALIPPWAALECERTGWTLLTMPTDTPSSAAARAALCPARPAPITRTSCVGTGADPIDGKSDSAVGFRPPVGAPQKQPVPLVHARRRLDNAVSRARDQDRRRLVLVPLPLPADLLALRLLRRRAGRAELLLVGLPAGAWRPPSASSARSSCTSSGHAAAARRDGIGIIQHPALDPRRHGADGPRSRDARQRIQGGDRGPGGDLRDRRRALRRSAPPPRARTSSGG